MFLDTDPYPSIDDVLVTPPRLALGLDRLDIEAVIVAIVDRDDFTADTDTRCRLARARVALEGELARMLAE